MLTKDAKISKPWSEDLQSVLSNLEVDPKKGLSFQQIQNRKQKFGPNKLKQKTKKSTWTILLNQLKNIIILILLAASILSFIFTSWVDGLAIAVAIVLNTLIGFFMELKAVRSMEALRQMEKITAKVRREEKLTEIAAAQLVPGDIVEFEGGEIVPADVRLIESSKLQSEESMLTGESEPVCKAVEPVEEEAPLPERKNMLFKGTSITRGSGKAVVVSIGMNTQLGKISEMVQQSDEEFTPLEKKLSKFGTKLLWITFAILIIVSALGIWRGKDVFIMIETAVALAVAAIPEGLPIVATLAMARGMVRMADRNALVNRLGVVEILGGTSVIFTDKTGTLTENKMTVTELVTAKDTILIKERKTEGQQPFEINANTIQPSENTTLMKTIRTGVLCNNASLEKGQEHNAVGEPLEVALLELGKKAGIHRPDLLEQMPEHREEAFDPATKMMATFNKQKKHFYVAVKGAPEAVLNSCSHVQHNQQENELNDQQRKEWLKKNTEMAKKGLRVLAVAYKKANSTDTEPYKDLILLGLTGMKDPPRKEVKNAISLCKKAGLRVVMVTGDQTGTAAQVARELGLLEDKDQELVQAEQIKSLEKLSQQENERFLKASVFARVSPEQKLDLISIHRNAGSVVAMTGDGVNDAPGLRKADIGIAMGKRGTQVAQEASDMVLKDDSFNTIVEAIRHGRVIFDNIRKFIVYLLSGNVGEIMIVFFASLIGSPLPLLPLQILLLNIINDVFPSLALGFGQGSDDVMNRKPRNPKESVLKLKQWLAVFGYGLLIAIAVLASFGLSLKIFKYKRL